MPFKYGGRCADSDVVDSCWLGKPCKLHVSLAYEVGLDFVSQHLPSTDAHHGDICRDYGSRYRTCTELSALAESMDPKPLIKATKPRHLECAHSKGRRWECQLGSRGPSLGQSWGRKGVHRLRIIHRTSGPFRVQFFDRRRSRKPPSLGVRGLGILGMTFRVVIGFAPLSYLFVELDKRSPTTFCSAP